MSDDTPDDDDSELPIEREEIRELVESGVETASDLAERGLSKTSEVISATRETLAGSDRKRAAWRMAGAVGVVVAVFVAFGAVAYLGWGLWSGVAFGVGVGVGASAPPLAILMTREVVPNIAAIGLAIAAMVAFRKAALVRRADGQYEWTALREDAAGRYARLDSGTRVPIDAADGDLFAFGFGQLAVVEAHGENLAPFRETHTPGASDRSVDERAGIDVRPPRREDGGILVSLAKIQRRVRGSASSMLVRRGRDKALDERGGTGQLSQLWTMAFATVLLLVGFGMTAGVLLI